MDFYKLIEKTWMSKHIYYWLTILYVSVNIYSIAALDWRSKKFKIIVCLLFLGYSFLVFIVRSKRKYPKFNKSTYGILFAIDIENDEQYKVINKKFVKPFQNLCVRQLPTIESKMMNAYCCEKFYRIKQNDDKLIKLAKKKHCNFIIYGDSYFGSEHEDLECRIEIDGFLNLHKGIEYRKNWILSRDMGALWLKIRNIEISKAKATEEYALLAEQLELVFKYILASTFLLCDEYQKAKTIFEMLVIKLESFKNDISVINDIKNGISLRLAWTYVLLAKKSLSEYYQNHDKTLLENMKVYIDNIIIYDENSYDAKILLGFFYFLYDRNVKKAVEILNKCNKEKDLIWKQNIAFLKLYKDDSIPNFLNAYRVYKKIFSQNQLTMNGVDTISSFIHMILEQEPDKKQLYFILFLIYYYIGDKELENEYYSYFKGSYLNIFNNDRINDMLFKIGKEEKILVA